MSGRRWWDGCTSVVVSRRRVATANNPTALRLLLDCGHETGATKSSKADVGDAMICMGCAGLGGRPKEEASAD